MDKLELITNLKLMSRDYKIKVFTIIILLLFILSAISSSLSNRKLNADFQRDYQTQMDNYAPILEHADRLLCNSLHYIQKPSEYNMIVDKRGLPDRLTTTTVVDAITPYSLLKHGKSYFQLNWLFIIGMIGSFCALVFSYDNISLEKRQGTLKLKLITGMGRKHLLFSKYLANLILFAVTFLLGILLSLLTRVLMGESTDPAYIGISFIIYIISLIYISFFVLAGLGISLLKNERSGIIIALSLWLLFIIIIPNLTWIFGKKTNPIPSFIEVTNLKDQAWSEEFQIWSDKYDDNATMTNKVSGNSYLGEGYRSGAVQASDEKIAEVIKDTNKQYISQLEKLEKLSFLSPYSQLSKMYQNIVLQGLLRLNREMNAFSEHRNHVENILKEIDSNDENSLHLWYSWASQDGNNNQPFSSQPYTDKQHVILTSFPPISLTERLLTITPLLSIILLINLLGFIWVSIQMQKYDVR